MAGSFRASRRVALEAVRVSIERDLRDEQPVSPLDTRVRGKLLRTTASANRSAGQKTALAEYIATLV